MKWFVLLLFSCIHCTILPAIDTEGNLHALLVCDTSSHTLRQSYAIDLARMKDIVQGIAYQSNLQLHLKKLTGKGVSATTIRKWIASLPSSSNDVALVYYVGREGRSHKKNGHWPSIRNARKGKKDSISADAVAKAIQKRKPRLTLVFFDCYEHLMKISRDRVAINEWKIPMQGDHTQIKPIFIKANGTFIACSGPRGEKGFGIVQGGLKGGVFTSALIESIALNIWRPTWGKGCLTLNSYYQSVFGRNRKRPLIRRQMVEPHYAMYPIGQGPRPTKQSFSKDQ